MKPIAETCRPGNPGMSRAGPDVSMQASACTAPYARRVQCAHSPGIGRVYAYARGRALYKNKVCCARAVSGYCSRYCTLASNASASGPPCSLRPRAAKRERKQRERMRFWISYFEMSCPRANSKTVPRCSRSWCFEFLRGAQESAAACGSEEDAALRAGRPGVARDTACRHAQRVLHGCVRARAVAVPHARVVRARLPRGRRRGEAAAPRGGLCETGVRSSKRKLCETKSVRNWE